MDNNTGVEEDVTINMSQITSPSQLQEVTLGPNGTLADQTKISPMRGRSVKEYDEQLTALRKENFNLKLRIYFLEERMGPTYRLEDKDNVVRKNIEYQVELESLRKELDEKQELLCQAVKAMELEETEHKKVLSRKDLQIIELNDRLEAVQKDTTALTEMNDMLLQKQNKLIEDSSVMYTEAFNLQDMNSKTKLEIEQLQQQISDLETQLAEERQHSAMLENNLQDSECIHSQCQDLELELKERDCKIQKLCTDLEQKSHTISSLNLKIRTLEDELNNKKVEIESREKELGLQEKTLREQQVEIEEYKKKISSDKEQRQIENLKSSVISRDNTIADLESKLERCKGVIRNLEAKLEKIALENKRHEDEINSMKSQRRSKSVNENSRFTTWSPGRLDQRSMSVNSEYPDEELEDIQNLRESLKKKEDQYKIACNMIQSFLVTRKSLEKDNRDLQSTVEKKELKIAELQKELTRLATLAPGFDNMKVALPSNNPPEYENSGEETDEGVSFQTSNKCKAMSLEWEKQSQEMIQISEKDEQLEICRKQFEATSSALKNKDNRITELETEIEELYKQLTDAHLQFEELKNAKKEELARPSSTWTRVTEEKDKKIEKLESEVRKHTYNLQGIVNTELWEKNREIERLQSRLTDKLKVKDDEINKLEKELMGKNMQLKMLKDKIEELGIHVNLPSSLMTAKQDDRIEIPEEVNVLKEQLKLSTEKSKYLQKTVEELTQQLRNTPERESDSKLLQIKAEFTRLQQELEKSEKCKISMSNACVLLTTRLEELANFLNSLLKHKSVLGLLGIKQHSAIKHAIDQSLDLSKTFNMSLMGEENSLAQLSALSGLLNVSQASINMSMLESFMDDEPSKRASLPLTQSCVNNNVSLTYNSHLTRQIGDSENVKDIINEQNEIITVLRQQIETMKKEIEIRDMELANQNNIVSDTPEKSLKNDNELVEALLDMQDTSSVSKRSIEVMSPGKIYQTLLNNNAGSPLKHSIVDNQSESETWSEPDRDVSQARMGLDAEVLKSSTSSTARIRLNKNNASGDGVSTESTEEDKLHSQNRISSKRSSGSSESRLVSTLQETINILENKLKEKDNELLSLQCKQMDDDNKLKESQIKLYSELDEIKKDKIELEKILRESEKMIETLEDARKGIENKLLNMSMEKEKYIADITEKEKENEVLKEKIVDLEKVIEDNESDTNKRIQENEDKWMSKLSKMEREAELRIEEIKTATNQLKEKYESEWIQKEELNKHNAKLEMVYSELEAMKEILRVAENKGKMLELTEIELNKKLEENEKENREKIIALKRELNEYALRTSQAVLDRTKVSNEKLKLEHELRKIETRDQEKTSEFVEKEKQFITIKNNIQKQLSQLELQKSHLQLKVTELETTNVELQNRILRLQSGETINWPKSTPSSPIKISETFSNAHVGKHSLCSKFIFSRQRSDMSGYVSEDVLTDDNDIGLFNRSAPGAFHWFPHSTHNVPTDISETRNIANSSPDLGIESDPGRFSSLETNVSRPLLQTLELTASMNNLLSDPVAETAGMYCNIPTHKTLISQNDELQRTVSRLETGLEKTMSQLKLINKNKKQVEKAVCKQIHKTSIVLRKARANLDSGSENEVLRQ